ncbi:MAG TPA: antibiotic biosynthesis monooxygenase [Candidatus Angelobacter sp.]|nr:antibiotic biosynthesis monooxygenase [Candidatus Angelobacter sp.]
MFARMLQFEIRPEKKAEFITVLKNEVVPILKKQVGFLEILPLFPLVEKKTVVNISIWATQADAERYQKEVYPRVNEIVKPFLLTPVTVTPLTLETELCQHFEEILAA